MIIALAHFANEPKENPYVWRLGSSLKRLGIDVRPLPASSLFWFRYRSARIASTIHFQWFETQVGSPIFLKMFMKTILFLLQLKICKAFGKRLVWTLHNSLSHEAQFPRFERWGMRRMAATVDTILVHCESVMEEMSRLLGVDIGKLHCARHGNFIDLYPNEVSKESARESLGIRDTETVVLFLGAVRPYKGLDRLIEEFRYLDLPDTRLLVAGRPLDAAIRSDIESRCENIDSITLRLEFVDDSDMQLYFGASDIVAFPYRSILMSGAVILAMSFGRPCVAPMIGCLPSVLDASSNFLYSQDDEIGLRRALEQAIRDKSRLPEMGAANFARAKSLDWDEIAAETARHYR